VVGRVSARRCLPVRVGLSSSASQYSVPLFCVALADAPRVVAVGTGPADAVAAEGSTADGVRTAVGSGLGDAELGVAYPAIQGDGFA
jgi:hypothetical protein